MMTVMITITITIITINIITITSIKMSADAIIITFRYLFEVHLLNVFYVLMRYLIELHYNQNQRVHSAV